MIALFIALPIYTLWATAKYAPKNQAHENSTKVFINYYKSYVLFATFMIFLGNLSDLFAVEEAPNFYQNETSNLILYGTLIGNIVRVVRPLILNLIRLRDPDLQRDYRKVLCLRCLAKKKRKQTDLEEKIVDESMERDRVMSLDVELVHKKLKSSAFIDQIQHNLKVQAIYTMLAGFTFILDTKGEKKEKTTSENLGTNDYYKKESKATETVVINENIMKDEKPEVF